MLAESVTASAPASSADGCPVLAVAPAPTSSASVPDSPVAATATSWRWTDRWQPAQWTEHAWQQYWAEQAWEPHPKRRPVGYTPRDVLEMENKVSKAMEKLHEVHTILAMEKLQEAHTLLRDARDLILDVDHS